MSRPPISYRRLGQSGLKVSPIALGTMQFGWSTDETNAFEIMDRYVELGGNLLILPDAKSNLNGKVHQNRCYF